MGWIYHTLTKKNEKNWIYTKLETIYFLLTTDLELKMEIRFSYNIEKYTKWHFLYTVYFIVSWKFTPAIFFPPCKNYIYLLEEFYKT